MFNNTNDLDTIKFKNSISFRKLNYLLLNRLFELVIY